MFKIKDPKFYTLMTEIKELRDEKKEIDYEITELPWIASEIDDLKKEIVMINKKIPELIKQKNQCQKKLEELQNKFKEENQDQLQENSELLENKIKKMEKEAQKIINKDFRSFIYTMNKKNTVIKYLYSDTHTTPIMDEFANDDDKDFLVLRGIFSDKDLVVTKRQNNVEVANVPSPTMTELKKYKNKSCVKGRLAPLIHEICKYDSSKLKNGQKVQFNKPFPLGGQTSANQTGYGWEWDWSNGCGDYIEGTYYGEVTTFFVIGFIFRGNKYFL